MSKVEMNGEGKVGFQNVIDPLQSGNGISPHAVDTKQSLGSWTEKEMEGNEVAAEADSDPGDLTPTVRALAIQKEKEEDRAKSNTKSDSGSRPNSASHAPQSLHSSGSSTTSLGPQDSFTKQFLASAAKLKNSILKTEPVSFKDIAQNPSLGRRAQAEIDSHRLKGVIEDNALSGRPHDMEIARLQVSLDAVEQHADQEKKICSKLADAILAWFLDCRRAVERLLGMLQAVCHAELAYTRALNAMSKVKLQKETDGDDLRSALSKFSAVPQTVSERHQNIAEGMSEILTRCKDSMEMVREQCKQFLSDDRSTSANVTVSRKDIHTAFVSHRNACSAADDAILQNKHHSKSAPAKIDLDPWISEGKVVSEQASLLSTQEKRRIFLHTAFEQVLKCEEQRAELLKEVVHSFLHSYRSELSGNEKQEEALARLTDNLDPQADLDEFSISVDTHEKVLEELALRQNEAFQSASQDLLCSPDIVRQGQMARWITGTGKWLDCHCVLTRSGFLHWLKDTESYIPMGSLNLSKCQLDGGEAPKFHITETPSGFFSKAKRQMFEAPSVEECCEWTIAVRESIASRKP